MKKRMTIWARTAKVLFLAILSSFGTNAMAQTRIAVVSDIHVMAPSLLEEGAETQDAWKNYYSDQRKMLQQSAGLFDQFVTTLTNMSNDVKPHVLLITGDLTKDGEQLSHDYVKAGLQTLEGNGIQVYVIPGNHDFGAEGNNTKFKTDGTTEEVDALSVNNFATFYADYGYGLTSTPDENSLSYMVEIDDDLYLLAIDSHDGNVSQETLDWIQTQASGKRVIAMMHHPLFPHIEGANMFVNSYTVNNYATVRNALIAAGVNVILTGHFHTSDIAYDWNESQTNGIYDINTGSLISYPCDYRMLTLSSNKSTLSVATASLTETPVLIPSGSTSWKAWLHNRVKTIAKSQGEAKIPSLRDKLLENNPNMPDIALNMAISLARSQINELAEFAADLFILHAEGNEPVSQESGEYGNYYNQAETYDGLASSLGYDLSFINLAHSMLEDKSNYGNDHVNQTNDRTLAINLNSPSSLLLELDNNDDNSSVINYYNGKTATVTLTGRTLYKDEVWNTICLPFDINDFSGTIFADADIRALSTTIENESKKTGLDTDGTLYLNFSGPTTSILAGVPYIVKWSSGENIPNPSFSNVNIKNTTPESVSVTSDDNAVTFCGTYASQQFTVDDPNILLLGIDNDGKSILYYPQPNTSDPENPKYPILGACRAYFTIDPDASGAGNGARNFVLNFGSNENSTGIIAIGNSQLSTLHSQLTEWFTLDGRRLSGKPTAKGLYIHAGRKVVIK